MKIYKKAKLVEERNNYSVELVPLTREGKKSKRGIYGWSFDKGSITVSASTLANYKGREEVYHKLKAEVSLEKLEVLAKSFPKAVIVFEHSSVLGFIYICKNERGNLKVSYIYANFTVVDNLIVTKAKSEAPSYYPVEIHPISFTGESYRGHKVYIDAAAHEAILLVEKNNYDYLYFGSVYKEMYYIDTRTLETKKIRKFFDGVEL